MLGVYSGLCEQWPFSTAKRSYCKWSKNVLVLGLIILELNDSSILCKSMIRNQVTWIPKILRPLDDMSMHACFCGQYARRGILEASHWEPGPRARANKGANAGETGVGNQTRVCVRALFALVYAISELGAGKGIKKPTSNVGFSKQLGGSTIPTSLNHAVYSSDHEMMQKKGRPNIVLCWQSCAPSLLVGDTPSILWI